jgi:hypothetical protein
MPLEPPADDDRQLYAIAYHLEAVLAATYRLIEQRRLEREFQANASKEAA